MAANEKIREVLEKIDKTGGKDACWLWTGKPHTKTGYGRVQINNKRYLVHRLVYSTEVGDPGDLCVLHRCDNPYCCNPKHLFLGTIGGDNADKVSKKRQAQGKVHGDKVRGSKHGKSKLTESSVRQIRSLHINGMPQVEIAKRMKISKQAINDIIRGRRWSHA